MRDVGLRSAASVLAIALLRQRHKSRLSMESASFRRRRSYLIKLARFVAKHNKPMEKENDLSTL